MSITHATPFTLVLLGLGCTVDSACENPTGECPVADVSESTTSSESDSSESDSTDGGPMPVAPKLQWSPSPIKQFDFDWAPTLGAESYQLLERASAGEPFELVKTGLAGGPTALEVPLHLRSSASYLLQACNEFGCTNSAPADVEGNLVEAIGYFKASNTEADDHFGGAVAVSGDGNTLAVGAYLEDSNAAGIDGSQANGASASGAVYVFVRDPQGEWMQQAYIKASNPGVGDWFGFRVALSADGATLAVGAHMEDSAGADQGNNTANSAGAVYVFARDDRASWSQQAYVKASSPNAGDMFGKRLALADDGATLAVGAFGEDSSAAGVDGDQSDNTFAQAGAAYLFVRDLQNEWTQSAYIKASNPSPGDNFGHALALTGDGTTLAIGAMLEDSVAAGIDGDQSDETAQGAGAVYVFTRDDLIGWSQQAYIKASNPGSFDEFGTSVALAANGTKLAVGAVGEDGGSSGFDGDQSDESSSFSGAVYVFGYAEMTGWVQQAYIKPSNPDPGDGFGWTVALAQDGSLLVVGANGEQSSATGIGGEQFDDSTPSAGAAYGFTFDPLGMGSQTAYVKASNTAGLTAFANDLSMSADGATLAIGAYGEASNATGIGGDQTDTFTSGAGAVYLY